MKYIIRADYYSNGDILPIGLTDESGDSYIISNVKSRVNTKTGEKEYECFVNKKKLLLTCSTQEWKITEM